MGDDEPTRMMIQGMVVVVTPSIGAAAVYGVPSDGDLSVTRRFPRGRCADVIADDLQQSQRSPEFHW
jgi:hypothetical protein